MKNEENFFPTDNYNIPKSPSNYMQFEDGKNKFRVLSSAIVGYEYWNTQNKPIRSEQGWEEMPSDIRMEKNGSPSKVKHFWAFVVYNYNDKRIQILEITQKGIMTTMKGYITEEAWGSPKGYDFVVSKSGQGLDTEYAVIANPHTTIDPEIVKSYESKTIDLTALFEGLDPFQVSQ